jgi:hypothetical protein
MTDRRGRSPAICPGVADGIAKRFLTGRRRANASVQRVSDDNSSDSAEDQLAGAVPERRLRPDPPDSEQFLTIRAPLPDGEDLSPSPDGSWLS